MEFSAILYTMNNEKQSFKLSYIQSSHFVRDAILGMSDGLTVPFALAAGLSGAVDSLNIIIAASLAEIAAGCISMGLGGYLAGKSDVEHYDKEKRRQQREIRETPENEAKEVVEIMQTYGVDEVHSQPIIEALKKDHGAWTRFMMRFKRELEEPEPNQALKSGLVIGGAYVVGGIIPLLPYFFADTPREGLIDSIVITALTLVVFGFVKGKISDIKPWSSALRTLGLGGAAAFTAYAVAKWIG